MTTFGILDINLSIQRFTNDFIEEMRTDDIAPTLEFYNFDSRNDQAELPKNDLFGPNGFAFDEESAGFMTIATAFVSATDDDRNGLRHNTILHHLHKKLRPGRRMAILDHETGEWVVDMVITQAALGPVGRTELRPMQALAITMIPAAMTQG
jgi:hypothetical protein